MDCYRQLAPLSDYPLHLGLTEAGMGAKGIVGSSAALAIVLQEGIGDTIRVSLTPSPGGDRCEEVRVAQQVLQSLGLRNFVPDVTACPGCVALSTMAPSIPRVPNPWPNTVSTPGMSVANGATSISVPYSKWQLPTTNRFVSA